MAIRSFGDDGGIGRDDWMRVAGCESAHLAFDPDDPRYIYGGCYLGQIEEFDMKTETSRDIRVYPELAFGVSPSERKYRFNWNAPVIVSEHDPNVIYHAGNVVLESTDRGHSWTEISPDLSRDNPETQGPGGFPITNEVSENYNTIMYLAESPRSADTLWAGTDDGLVHITRDGGENWENITPRRAGEGMVNTLPSARTRRARRSSHSPSTSTTTTSPSSTSPTISEIAGTRSPATFLTGTGCAWCAKTPSAKACCTPAPRWACSFPSAVERTRTAARTGRNCTPATCRSCRSPISESIAATWSSPPRAARSGSSTTCRRSASSTPTRSKRSPTCTRRPRPTSCASRATVRPVAARTRRSARCLYYTLAEEPDLEEQTLTIEFVDSDGNVVRTLKSSADKGAEGGGSGSAYALPAEKGLNRAVWDFATDPIEHELDDFVIASGGDKQIDGYTTAAGNYTVRMTLGETEVEQPLTVRFDPRQEYDPAHMTEQQQLVKSAYDMLDEFQATLIGLRKIRDQAQIKHGIFEDKGETEKAEAMQAVIDAVDDWEAGNIATEREFFQDVLNWQDQLFTDLQFLYSTLDGAMPRVTEGMKQRHADLKGRFEDAIGARDAILDGAVADANGQESSVLVVHRTRPSHT